MVILLSASGGSTSTNALLCLCNATDALGFNNSLSIVLRIRTYELDPIRNKREVFYIFRIAFCFYFMWNLTKILLTNLQAWKNYLFLCKQKQISFLQARIFKHFLCTSLPKYHKHILMQFKNYPVRNLLIYLFFKPSHLPDVISHDG